MQQGRKLPHIFVHSLIAVHCLLLRLPSCDSLHIYYHCPNKSSILVCLQIVRNLPVPSLASYPLQDYALRGLRRGACGRKPLTHLPSYRSSHDFDDAMLWAASMAAPRMGIVFASERKLLGQHWSTTNPLVWTDIILCSL